MLDANASKPRVMEDSLSRQDNKRALADECSMQQDTSKNGSVVALCAHKTYDQHGELKACSPLIKSQKHVTK